MRSAILGRLTDWHRWRTQSANRRIFAAMLTVGSLTVVVKLVAMAKEMVVAHRFGVGDALDAYFIAYLLPSSAVSIIALSFNAALIPTYMEVREQEGPEAAQRLFSNVIAWSTALLLAASVLLGLLFPFALPALAHGFPPNKLALTRSLFYIMLPTLMISGLATTWGAILNAGERFALPAILPAITPLLTMALLLSVGKQWGVHALAISITCGAVLEVTLLAAGLRRRGVSLTPRWHGMDRPTRQVIHQYAPMVAGGLLMSGTNMVDQAMAAMLPRGSVTALNYGNKLVAVVLSIAGTTVATSFLPYFSRMVAQQDWNGLPHTLKTFVRLAIAVCLPVTLLLVVFSHELVHLLYERGAFTPGDTDIVARVQSAYVLQIPSFVAGIIGVRLLTALRRNQDIMRINAISLVLNATADYLLMRVFGVPGIALATALVYLCSASLIFYCVFIQLRKVRAATAT
jgi:putative peptidoglycan lipid II flippase